MCNGNLFTPHQFVIGSLDGIDSNAFSLIAHFRKLAKEAKWSGADVDRVVEQAKTGTHDHLIFTLMMHMQDAPTEKAVQKVVVVDHVSEEQYKELNEQFTALFNEKVIVGFDNIVSPTHFGEICRALGRVQYRLMNDGDHCFVGYGCETCGGEATFLKHHVNETVTAHFNQFEKSHSFGCDSSYTQWFYDLMGLVMHHMQTATDKPTEVDMSTIESEWDNHLCQQCGCYFPNDEINGEGHCDDCQEELDEEEDE